MPTASHLSDSCPDFLSRGQDNEAIWPFGHLGRSWPYCGRDAYFDCKNYAKGFFFCNELIRPIFEFMYGRYNEEVRLVKVV